MASFWKRFTTRLSSVWKGSFIDTLESLIKNAIKSIGETSNVFLLALKVLWLIILVVILAIILFFKKLFRLVKRLFIITLQEINFYAALMLDASKNLRKKWGDISVILVDIKDYLVDNIGSDNSPYSNHFHGKFWQLFLWDFPVANIWWVLLFVISLSMSIILSVSTILIIPPIIHRIAREALSTT